MSVTKVKKPTTKKELKAVIKQIKAIETERKRIYRKGKSIEKSEGRGALVIYIDSLDGREPGEYDPMELEGRYSFARIHWASEKLDTYRHELSASGLIKHLEEMVDTVEVIVEII